VGTLIGVLSVDRLFGEEVSFEEDIRFLTILAALVAQLVSLNDQVKAREDNLIRANSVTEGGSFGKVYELFLCRKKSHHDGTAATDKESGPTKATVLLLGESGTGRPRWHE